MRPLVLIMKKKLFILFSLFSLCLGISLHLILGSNKVQSVSAETISRDLVYDNLILYDVGDIDDPQPNKVYSFNTSTIATAGTFNIMYFEQGSFKVLNNDSGTMRLNIFSSGDTYTVSLQYRIMGSGSYSTLLNFVGPKFSVVFKTFSSPSSVYTNFISSYATDEAIPVYKTDSDYYSQLFSQITNLNTQIQGLNSQITILQSSIANNQSIIAQYQSTIATLNSQIDTLHNTIVNIQNEYDSLEAEYESLEAQYGALEISYEELEASYEDLLSSEASLLTFINGFINSTFDSDYVASTLIQGITYLNLKITSNETEIDNLLSQISQLDAQIEADTLTINQLYDTITELEAQIDSVYATSNVFGLIKNAFSGIVPLLDLQLAPNISIGMLLTIPFVISIIGFAIRLLG